MSQIFNVVKLFGKLGLPFRGHDKSSNSSNKGVFKEFIQFLANNGDSILADHLKNSPHNTMYLSPEIQNEMISIIGESIKSYILK